MDFISTHSVGRHDIILSSLRYRNYRVRGLCRSSDEKIESEYVEQTVVPFKDNRREIKNSDYGLISSKWVENIRTYHVKLMDKLDTPLAEFLRQYEKFFIQHPHCVDDAVTCSGLDYYVIRSVKQSVFPHMEKHVFIALVFF